ncbi:MAG: patatin-like phospholipase family protein [Pseudomonadota bacterium]
MEIVFRRDVSLYCASQWRCLPIGMVGDKGYPYLEFKRGAVLDDQILRQTQAARLNDDANQPVQFEQIVFSGGGTRCFWQGGFLGVIRQPLGLSPKRITGVSAGALSAAGFIADNASRVLALMGDAFERHSLEPVVPAAILRGKAPHERIYRAVISEAMDAAALDAIAQGPQFHITLAVPPKWLPPLAGTYLSFVCYKLDQIIRSNPHIVLPSKLGARKLMVDGRQAARDGHLVDLICAAATIPPVFGLAQWPPGSGRYVMDAGTTDNAPMPEPDEGQTLLLMTRHYRNLPSAARLTCVEPKTPVPASKLDFRSRAKIERGWAIGEQDGHSFLAECGL